LEIIVMRRFCFLAAILSAATFVNAESWKDDAAWYDGPVEKAV